MISRRTCPSRPQKFTAERNSGLSCQIGAAITRMSAESATSRSRKVGRPPITALRRSSEQPSFQPLSRFCQSHERPLKSLSVTAAQPFVPPPMHSGLVASLNRPGGNVTGIAFLTAELAPKRLQFLRELVPNAAVFGVLSDPAIVVTQTSIADRQAAARTLGLQFIVVNARTDSDLETAFATFSQRRAGAVLVTLSTFPSALAALRLMTSSNLVGCSTGRSDGFSPLRMRPA